MRHVRLTRPSAHRIRIDVDAWDHTFWLSQDERDYLDIELPEDGSQLTIQLSLEPKETD